MRIDLDLATNMFGALSSEVRARLTAAIEHPGDQTWSDAHSIILSMRPCLTLWQAVIAIDPTFPKTGPISNAEGKQLSRWARTPDSDTILQAINYATH